MKVTKEDLITELERIISNSKAINTDSLYDAYWYMNPRAEGLEDEYGMGPAQSRAYDEASARLEGNETAKELQSKLQDMIDELNAPWQAIQEKEYQDYEKEQYEKWEKENQARWNEEDHTEWPDPSMDPSIEENHYA